MKCFSNLPQSVRSLEAGSSEVVTEVLDPNLGVALGTLEPLRPSLYIRNTGIPEYRHRDTAVHDLIRLPLWRETLGKTAQLTLIFFSAPQFILLLGEKCSCGGSSRIRSVRFGRNSAAYETYEGNRREAGTRLHTNFSEL
jgi:hypothetical protein